MMKIMAVTSGRDVSSYNKRIKLAVVGDKHVGKTSLISRYVYNTFSQHYTYTQGGDLKRLNMTINNNRVDVTLVDAAGHKYVRSLIKTLYRDVQGILVVFDVTRENTFRSVQEWLKQIELVNANSPVIFLVGNKQDLTSHRCVPHEEATMQSQRLRVPYYETSARTGHNVHETFADLFRAAWQHSTPRYMPVEHITLVRGEVLKKTNNDSCCSIT